MDRVVLVVNNFSWFEKRAFRTWLPAVPIITALLKDICDFSVLDANVRQLSIEETERELSETKADLVLISGLSVDYQKQYHEMAAISKRALKDCTVMMGGVYPTVLPDQVMDDPNIDYAMIGHAEERLPMLVSKLLRGESIIGEEGIAYREAGEVKINALHSRLYQVKEMVKPDFSCIDVEKYFELQQGYSAKNYSTECAEKRTVNIISSYGCPYNCFFCANRSISGSRVIYRKCEDILEEIDYFVKNFGVQQISFMDDNIVSDKKRAAELFEAIIERKYNLEIQIGNLAAWDLNDEILELLKRAGCTRIGISVESGSQRVLSKIINKPLKLEIIPPLVKKFRELDIMMVADFIIGLPGETWEEIQETFNYAENMGADLCNINVAVPYPGTGMYTYMRNNDMLPDDFSFKSNFYVTGLASTDEFNPSENMIMQGFEWERINASTPEKRKRAKRVLRISDEELKQYTKAMRQSALNFVKHYY